jgi:uncharacterized radical SAM protein YgiQ
MGCPRLFVGVSAGNLDSMLSKLTAQKKVRSQDDYAPGGRPGLRPNRASVVYANLCRQAFPGLPIVLGGIEASLRRLAHYDYWSDSVRRSVLLDAKAHVLIFGMAETAVLEVARRLRAGSPLEAVHDIRGTVHVRPNRACWEPLLTTRPGSPVLLPSFEQVRDSRLSFAEMTRLLQRESHPYNARPVLQPHGNEAVYANPPPLPLSAAALDALYALPFARAPHPDYRDGVPAFESVRRSVAAVRGCFGGCAFCSITEHEGRAVQSRSHGSVLDEIRELAARPDFDGTLSDVGGPTANMYGLRCGAPELERLCRRRSCLHPKLCCNLITDHGPYLKLLRHAQQVPKVRHVFVNSGIRYDLAARSPAFVRALAAHHTSGQLSVAPEHVSPHVLRCMRKPEIGAFESFSRAFLDASRRAGKQQVLAAYLIVGHPGSTLHDTIELALYLKRRKLRPRQVQEFIPTPMSLATAMYHTGLDPSTGAAVEVTRDLTEKRMMKALVLWWDDTQWPLARAALRLANRADLIGRGAQALIPPQEDRRRRPR